MAQRLLTATKCPRRANDVRQSEVHTDGPLAPQPTCPEVETVAKRLKGIQRQSLFEFRLKRSTLK